MAESGSGQEKTEQASSKKLDDARNEGQIPRSRELNTLVMLLTACAGFYFLGERIINGLLGVLHKNFSFDRSLIFQPELLPSLFWQSILDGIQIILPFFALMVVAAIVAPLPLGGLTFSTKALMPKFDRLDPIKGMKKVINWKGFIELMKALVKFAIVSFTGILLLKAKIDDFINFGAGDLHSGLAQMGSDLIWVFFLLSCTLALVAVVDVPFQMWDFSRQQKMTQQEVKDEHKDTEGSPELKGKIRQTQREIAQRRMMEQVPMADVVVTNPSHFAVALRYDQMKMGAPVVVASGMDLVALQIRRVAQAHDVPVLESPPLARALYYSADLNQAIPAGLYLAVAQVLAYVYQLRQYTLHGGVEPTPLSDLPIPDDLRRD